MIAVTGANGFVGAALLAALSARCRSVRALVRARDGDEDGEDIVAVGDIGPNTAWREALAGVDTVIHTAARVHVQDDRATDPLEGFLRVNAEGTRRLAEQAVVAGVRRLVFLSSVKVNGEGKRERAFSAFDQPIPEGAYAISKWRAEQALQEVASRTGIEVVVVRSPLVYGPGVKANFARLAALIRRGLPLPLGAVVNRRSLVSLDNLIDLLIICIDHPAAAGQTFLVSDGKDLSTPDLIRQLAVAMEQPARIFPVPVPLLRLGGRLLRRASEMESLVGSLYVDIRHTCEELGWTPPMSVEEGLRRVVQ